MGYRMETVEDSLSDFAVGFTETLEVVAVCLCSSLPTTTLPIESPHL